MKTDQDRQIVLCFDRDHTVSVNPHPDREAVPIGWVQYWAHEKGMHVWATGNQHLRLEAEIPGIEEAEWVWKEYLGGEVYEYQNSQFKDYYQPRRRDGLRLIQDVYEAAYPDEDFRFVVVDDVDVSDLSDEGPWTHYFPWDFVEAIEDDSTPVEKPPADAYRNDGVPFNSTEEPDFNYDMAETIRTLRDQAREGRAGS